MVFSRIPGFASGGGNADRGQREDRELKKYFLTPDATALRIEDSSGRDGFHRACGCPSSIASIKANASNASSGKKRDHRLQSWSLGQRENREE
jgi:hypothetical protein